MTFQKSFNYHFSELKDQDNFFVNSTNEEAYKVIKDSLFNQNVFLNGPKKSGKSHLCNIWKQINKAIIFHNNFDKIIKLKKNVIIENLFTNLNEEEIFHIINHCKSFNLKILITSSKDLNKHEFKLKDLSSRLKSFYHIKINQPDDEMCKLYMNKLFYDKQIIIKNAEIFDFIFKRINRTYNDIYLIVKKIDKLSLEKKRQLTIPLIKEII
tara:strand:+ start:615 stop:1247 length:633 start_codon:yes stop_codon:yes gene_type:complete